MTGANDQATATDSGSGPHDGGQRPHHRNGFRIRLCGHRPLKRYIEPLQTSCLGNHCFLGTGSQKCNTVDALWSVVAEYEVLSIFFQPGGADSLPRGGGYCRSPPPTTVYPGLPAQGEVCRRVGV